MLSSINGDLVYVYFRTNSCVLSQLASRLFAVPAENKDYKTGVFVASTGHFLTANIVFGVLGRVSGLGAYRQLFVLLI